MSNINEFMDGIGRKGRRGKSKKEIAKERKSIEFSDRMDSAEEAIGIVETEAQPGHEQSPKYENDRESVVADQYSNNIYGQSLKSENEKTDYFYYFSFVLDATADVALVYDRIYTMLIRVVDQLEETRNRKSSERRKINMKIGITTFHDSVSEEEDDKIGGECFTDDFDAVRQRLRNMEFWGGDCVSGRECINEAQLEGLRRMALQRDSERKFGASCSQILITTSLPPVASDNETGYVSFTKDPGNIFDLGVRFALNIVLDKNYYDPDFKIVNRDGMESQEKSGYTIVDNIEDILNGIAAGQNQGKPFEDKADVVVTIVNDLLEASSLLSILS